MYVRRCVSVEKVPSACPRRVHCIENLEARCPGGVCERAQQRGVVPVRVPGLSKRQPSPVRSVAFAETSPDGKVIINPCQCSEPGDCVLEKRSKMTFRQDITIINMYVNTRTSLVAGPFLARGGQWGLAECRGKAEAGG